MDPAQKSQVVGKGDELIIGKHTYRVRNIVPSDTKKKLIGWIEIDRKPVK
jgi:hypothetical protein